MKRFAFILLCVVTLPVFAASVIRQAREALKKNQNLEQTAKTLLAEADKEGVKHADRVQCLRLAAECSRKLHADENRKMFLKQKADTTRFYAHILDIFLRVGKADSLSRTPDEKGRVRPLSPRRVREMLMPYRKNLMGGGKFFYIKANYAEAFRFLDTYIRCNELEAFAPDTLELTDTLMPMAAYLAVDAARATGNYDGIIRHATLAQRAGLKSHLIQEYLCTALAAKGDSMASAKALTEGLRRFESHPFFFSHILDALASQGRYAEGLAFADSMLSVNDTRPLYWYAQSLMLLKLGRDRDAIDACDSCLVRDPDYVDAHYTKGIASLNLAVTYTETACTDLTDPRCKRDREVIQSLYNLAKLPMERVRELAPQDTNRWAAPLYRIYLHLNMGPQFDEIDRIVNRH